MALTTIAGTILVPMGVAPSNARLVFTLATWDMDNNIVWAPDPTIEPLSGSAYSIALESTTDKERQAAYKVELRWYSTLERTTMNEVLGIIAVPATGGPYDLPDLLSVPFVEPVPAEILALCLAAQSAASSAATSAAASAVDADLARDEAILYGGIQVNTYADLLNLTPAQVPVNSRVFVRDQAICYLRVASSGDIGPTTGGLLFDWIHGQELAYPAVAGGTAPKMMYFFDTLKGAVRYGGADPMQTNDEREYGVNAPSLDWWGASANRGLFSAAFGRNSLAYGTYTFALGHDCTAFGTASMVGGAGSCAGDPADINNTGYAFKGYCSFSWGKNNIVGAEKSAAFGEECKVHGRASIGLGYNARTGALNNFSHIGQFAAGYDVIAVGEGAVAIGKDISALGGSKLFGQGVNTGNPLAATGAEVGMGRNVTKATIVARPGPGTTTGVANVRLRTADSATAKGIEIADYDDSIKARINTQLTNGGGGGYWALQFDVMNAGAIVRGFDVDFDGTVSFLPATTNTHRIGSSTRAISYIYLQNAPIITSDARSKSAPKPIDDAALRAWARVRFCQYQLLDANGIAGGDMNVGVIAQQIVEAFAAEGLDALEWAIIVQSPLEDIEGESDDDRAARAADLRYGVNYTQAAMFEAELTRRTIAKQADLEARLAKLEAML